MVKAVILCAGKGTRLLPITEKIPKPMVPIKGMPLLEYNLSLCKKHGIRELMINLSHLPEQIKDYFGDGSRFGVKIIYSYEPELLGTSGALNGFKDRLDETFIVIYGDNLTDIDLTEMIGVHRKARAMATLALRSKPKEYKTQSLILADEGLVIKKIIEKPDEKTVEKMAGEVKLINSGIYVLEPEIMDFVPEGFSDFAYDIFPKMLAENKKVKGYIMDKFYFREVGKIEKYEIAKEEIESGKVKLNL